jgi:hypothetical protein
LWWNALPGKTYRVQYASDLPASSWSDLGNDVTASSSTASATDSVGSTRQRFYRIVLLD